MVAQWSGDSLDQFLEDSFKKTLGKSVKVSSMQDLLPNYWLAVQTPFFSQHWIWAPEWRAQGPCPRNHIQLPCLVGQDSILRFWATTKTNDEAIWKESLLCSKSTSAHLKTALKLCYLQFFIYCCPTEGISAVLGLCSDTCAPWKWSEMVSVGFRKALCSTASTCLDHELRVFPTGPSLRQHMLHSHDPWHCHGRHFQNIE